MSSSQAQSGVPFSIAADLQPCRLLELPPELHTHIASSAAPTLHFKARDASEPEAFLCTHNKTFLVRQVHTSNTVYITTPSPNASGTTAISQCASALEALPAPTHHAKSTLKSLLTPFNGPQDLDLASSTPHTKHSVFAHTPMSHAECDHVWKDLTAFEYSGQSFLPTATALVRVWKWLLELSYAHGVNLTSHTLQKSSIDTMLDQEDEWPRQFIDAVFHKLADADQESPALDQKTTVHWVGYNILETRYQNPREQSSMEKSSFIELWKDALPEAWRDCATLEMLKDSYKLSAGGKQVEFAPERIVQAEEAATGASKPNAAATGGKRKWHEKFAAARKQGRPS